MEDFKKGLRFRNFFVDSGVDCFYDISWKEFDARILNAEGEIKFEQNGVLFPDFWSQSAVNVVASKYFRGGLNSPDRESYLRDLIFRVVDTIVKMGIDGGYFYSEKDADIFKSELAYLIVNQYGTFNSPVWFNLGIDKKPQVSACFINSVEDSMDSIFELATIEGNIFKWGSGSGVNLSRLRSSVEDVAGGGQASGPVSFMKGYDSFAGVIKSGGRLRRSAKMTILDVDHPDILEFIWCKVNEEKKVKILIDAGYDGSINGEAYSSVFFQNSNNSVRVTDDFMRAALEKKKWTTYARTTGKPVVTYNADDILSDIAEATYQCGDPGMQFDTQINEWHTCPNSGRINASNPCLAGEVLLTTDRGLFSIESLAKSGKSFNILSGDGKFRKSIAFKTGIKDIYKAVLYSGHEILLTEDHLILSDFDKKIFVKACEIEQKVCVCNKADTFASVRNLETMRFEILGFATGDGTPRRIQKNGKASHLGRIYLKKDGSDDEVGELFKSIFEDYKIPKSEVKMISSKKFSDFWEEFCPEDYVYDRYIPDEILNDIYKLRYFLRGLFSANGSVLFDAKRVVLKTTSSILAHQVLYSLSLFGISSYLTKNFSKLSEFKNGKYAVRDSYDVNISPNSVLKFRSEIGFIQSNKMGSLINLEKFVSESKYRRTKIKSIEFVRSGNVYDFSEPVTNTGVANGIVVHNCSEYVFLDNTACNLASLNLLKFMNEDASFDTETFRHAVDIFITAQEIIIDQAKYPTDEITINSRRFRTLGLGYANLGAFLMARGLPYDSDEGRSYAGAITSLMTGEAYAQSARIAEHMGPFAEFERNQHPMLNVIAKHRDAIDRINESFVPENIMEDIRTIWNEAYSRGEVSGFRNAQTTALAPTGTIAFMMDCDTTGIEPDIALVKYKSLVGGGIMKIINKTVPVALKNLGYSQSESKDIVDYIEENGIIEGSPHIKNEHLPVFDCALRSESGTRFIQPMGHIKMMAAVQPFISGAISKTVNVQGEATVEEIKCIYTEAWRLGLKAIAIYRECSKQTQPLNTQKKKAEEKTLSEFKPRRRRLPDERTSITHKFSIAGHEGYLIIGIYEDGRPGEMFIHMAKAGSVVSGMMDSFAIAVSLSLQYGVPLQVLVDKYSHSRFEPSGFTTNPQIPIAKSIMDYIFRWLGMKFIKEDESFDEISSHEEEALPPMSVPSNGPDTPLPQSMIEAQRRTEQQVYVQQADAPVCLECGGWMTRSGTCYRCMNCGATSGCS